MATKQRPQQRKVPAPPLRPTIAALVPNDQAPGRNVTVGVFIVEQIKAGVDPINAAGVVGVTPAEFMSWMREGTQVFSRLNAGAEWTQDFTPDQQDCAVFASEAIRARSGHIARLSVLAEQAARGGLTKTTTRRKSLVTPTGSTVVEEWAITETTLPDMEMVRWKLEKLEPGVYGAKATLNVNVTDMTDTDAVTDVVEARMREIAASLSAEYPAIEAGAPAEPSP